MPTSEIEGAGATSAAAARRKAVTKPSLRLQFPYFPMMHGTIAASILTFMRRLLTSAVLVAALAVPTAATARPHGPNDGTLSVQDGRGVITIQGRGGVIGSFAYGSVRFVDPIDEDGTGPIVSGAERHREIGDTTDIYRGIPGTDKVRFRMIGGTFKIVVRGRGINLSFVGKGNVTLEGFGTDDDGTYAVNGGDYSALPS